MPNSKQTIRRLQIIDEMLASHRDCSVKDIVKECACQCIDVTERCIQKDIKFLEDELCLGIERYRTDVVSQRTLKTVKKHCLRYEEKGFSLFKPKFTEDERILLSSTLSLIGQFNGLPGFEGLDRLKEELHIEAKSGVIAFSHNPNAENSTLVGELFSAINKRIAIELHYHKFGCDTSKSIIFHPYLLKEYHTRWYVLGACYSDGFIATFALDRIEKIELRADIEYKPCDIEIAERFDDIVGVTYYAKKPIERVLIWVSDNSKYYLQSRPIHEYQVFYKPGSAKDLQLRSEYPSLQGGQFSHIDCIPNRELVKELMSYGSELLVLGPKSLKKEITNHVELQRKFYNGE